MKPIIAAAALSLIFTASAVAQTNGSSTTTPPSRSTTPTNSPIPTNSPAVAGPNAAPADTNDTSMFKRPGNQTGSVQAPSETEPSTGVPDNGTQDSPGAKGSNTKK